MALYLHTAESGNSVGFVAIRYDYMGGSSSIFLDAGGSKCFDKTTLPANTQDISNRITIDLLSDTVLTLDGTPADFSNTADCATETYNAFRDLINSETVTRMKIQVWDGNNNLAEYITLSYRTGTVTVHKDT